jgi:hypothetical protein
VRWKEIYECIILYSTEAWNGVCDTHLNGISRHMHDSVSQAIESLRTVDMSLLCTSVM